MKTVNETSAGGVVFKRLTTNDRRQTTLWLITQHSLNKSWGFPKGLIGDNEKNEPMESAALREVNEEGGVKAKIIHTKPVVVKFNYEWSGSPHGKTSKEMMLVHKTVYYYLMEYVSGDPKDHDWEMMDAKFLSEAEVKKTLTYPSDKQAFDEVLKLI